MLPTKVKRIGKYEVLDVLGKGGMGVVYKATDPSIGRLVAIKMITTGLCDEPDFLRRFYREAQSTGKLQHQNIVIVHELGDQDGAPFLVMEYLEGESLQAFINARRPMPLLDKLDLIIQACNGLHYAHQRNLVHRDIKPANLMVLRDGLVKIVDFGIARLETENVTVPGQVVGTIQYMSPEQINGVAVDCRTDIFSTAVVLYQLLTYTLPFQGKDTGSTLLKIINEPPPPLQNFLEAYPADLDAILQRALAKSREDRYPTAEDFAFDLGVVQDQLKRELVSEYLNVAEEQLARSEFSKAKEQVFQILRVDRQNRRANELLKKIQGLIQKQQRSEQARQLRGSAEEAIAAQDLDRALKYLDEALILDKQDAGLKQLRDSALQAKARLDKLNEALRRAESAQYAGELDEALAAAQEALAIDANSAEAQRLYLGVTRDISERNRQAQIQEYVSDAQRQISSRRFTAAIEALQRAEALDPTSPGIRDLKALAETGREQERRRKEIEQLSAEIQEAVDRDDYLVACAKADEAVARFPNENGLLKLQALAGRQRQAGEKRKFIEEHISQARRLLESRKTEEALSALDAARQRFPTEPALLSLLTVVRENLAQERAEARKQEYIQRAKEALRRKEYGEATSILETASAELNAPEIDDLLQFVKEEAATQAKRQALDAAAQEAHRLLTAEEFEDAIAFLKGVLQDNSDEELEILLAEAERQLNDFTRRVNEAIATAERLLRAERFIEAVRYLESQTGPCGRSAEFRAMLEQARHEQERMRTIATAVQSARLALSSQDFAAAAAAVEQGKNAVGDHPDLAQVAAEIDTRRREAANKAVSKVLADVRMLLLGRSYQTALEMLDGVAGLVELVPGEVRDRYESLYDEGTRGAERLRQQAASAPATTPEVAEDDTEQQIDWKVPSGSLNSRERDMRELATLVRESEGVTTHADLHGVTERARLIAERHPGDSEVATMATRILNAAEEKVRSAASAVITPPPDAPSHAAERNGQTDAPATYIEPDEIEEVVAQPEAPSVPAEVAEALPDYTVVPEPEAASVAPALTESRDETVVAEPKAASVAPVRTESRDQTVVAEPESASEAPVRTESRNETVIAEPEVARKPPAAPPSRDYSVVAPPERPRPVMQEAPSASTATIPVIVPPAQPPEKPGRSIWPVLAAVAGLIAVIVLALVVTRKSSPQPGAPAVVVHTDPPGATVSVGDIKCVAPDCNLQLQPGEYKIEASLAGYERQSAAVRVESGKTLPAITMALTPLPAAVRINTNFTRGNAWLDGRATGPLANGQLAINNLGAGEHKIKVSGPDGEAEFNVTTAPGRAPVVSGPISARDVQVLVASAMGGTAQLSCNCSGPVDLEVDGKASGNLNASGRNLGDLGIGVHQLRVGTGDQARTASVKLGEAPALEVFLNAERNAGTLVVDTSVGDADVVVNGKSYRATNGTLRVPLDVNNYVVQVKKPGYLPVAPQQASIRKNQETRLTFNLMPRQQKAAFAIQGGVPGARVAMDGKSVGVVDAEGQFSASDLSPGKHVIEIGKAGYESRSLQKVLQGGETLSLSGGEVQLAKLAPPPPTVDPADRDWAQVRGSTDSKVLETYAATYPASPHAADARRRVEQLDWDRARSSNDAAQLQAFLNRHPAGEFAATARGMLDKLNAARNDAEKLNAARNDAEKLNAARNDTDRNAVLQVIRDYAAAYDHKDLGRITDLYPGLGKQQVKKLHDVFRAARDVHMELTPTGDPQIKGDIASVLCRRAAQYAYPEGVQKPPDDTVTIQFRKRGSTWVMESIQ